MSTSQQAPGQRQFPCAGCGAGLVFAPGLEALRCPYCGASNPVPRSDDPSVVRELDLPAALAAAAQRDQVEVLTVRCDRCGAETTLDPHVTAQRCPFCDSAIVAQGQSRRQIRPQALVSFKVTQEQATQSFSRWLAGLWFAPNSLVRLARQREISGVYLPAWTFDADTTSHYTGQRGDDYWETQTYTAMEGTRRVVRTRQVRKTRWSYASGTVLRHFDDVLVPASRSLPDALLRHLEPWELASLVEYRDEYLAGFRAESYQVGLAEGFDQAKADMADLIAVSIRQQIGGDHQRIHSVDTSYADTTYKHILLPLWISAYGYRDKIYRFLVNARTGEVQGERPYSVWKILLLVLLIGAAIAIGVLLLQSR